jgi:hypothetical protein
MPKSKRSKVTSLTKTPSRSTKSAKQALSTEIQNEIDKYDHVWLFSVGDMRNEALKEVRSQWRGTGRLFLAKGKVMKKAVGEDVGGEYAEGLGEVGKVSPASVPVVVPARCGGPRGSWLLPSDLTISAIYPLSNLARPLAFYNPKTCSPYSE